MKLRSGLLASSKSTASFASLLDDLFTEHAEEDAAATPSPVGIDYISVVEELHSVRVKVFPDAVSLYDEMQDQSGPLPEEKQAAPAALSVDPAEIGRELGLESVSDAAALLRIRRKFAFRNHPDRMPQHMRQRAMLRMQIANMLIDEARRKMARSPRRT